jgi:polyphosphate glucokinase
MAVVGIDIGGSGIKGAQVDTRRGRLTTERIRVATPRPAKPDAVIERVAKVALQVGGDGILGITFPGVVSAGIVRTAANMHPSWVGADLPALVTARLGRPAVAINDADAAGVAELAHGAAKGQRGVVIVLTFGTGVGSGLFVNSTLVPNTELGHLQLDGADAEQRVAESVRERKNWSWKKWARHANDYLALVEHLFSPDLIVIGGGIAAKPESFVSLLTTTAPVRVATLGNAAGIVGAALVAQRQLAGTSRRSTAPAAAATSP